MTITKYKKIKGSWKKIKNKKALTKVRKVSFLPTYILSI